MAEPKTENIDPTFTAGLGASYTRGSLSLNAGVNSTFAPDKPPDWKATVGLTYHF